VEAVFALIGIVIGAILSGTIQLFIDWRNRRTMSRAAARVVFADLYAAMESYAEAARKKRWWTRGDLPLEAWHQYRDALAAVMDGDAFNIVNAAFQNVAYYDALRRAGPGEGEKLSPEGLQIALATSLPNPCWLALHYLHRAGMTWREKWVRPEQDESEILREFSLDPFVPWD
jgi:hypothetical protein